MIPKFCFLFLLFATHCPVVYGNSHPSSSSGPTTSMAIQ
jgi:hypothetical protein